MRRPEVVIDPTAIVAALDPSDPAHALAHAEMCSLVERYEADELLLVTHSDAVTGAMAELARRGAPTAVVDSVTDLALAFEIEVLHPDLLDDAAEVVEIARLNGLHLDMRAALTVELARRRRTVTVLAFDDRLARLDLRLLPAGDPDEDPAQSNPA